MRIGTVYRIINTSNGKSYVGATFSTLKSRWAHHKHFARKGVRSLIADAIREFGPDAFVIEPVATCFGRAALHATEAYLTEFLSTIEPHGYNRKIGQKHSEGTKQQMLGRTPWQKGKPSRRRGIPRSAETRAKISASQTGMKRSPEAIAKMVATKTGAKVLKKRRAVIDQRGKVYSSVQECADAIGVSISAVSMVLNGKRPQTKGFVLKFAQGSSGGRRP